MPDGFSTAVSIYAACEADEARQAAERAEMRAFVNGYVHSTATPEERQRYVESVGVLYPQAKTHREMTPSEKRVAGGIIVGLFVWLALGAVYGKLRYGEASEGVAFALAALVAAVVGALIVAVLAIGVALLFGYG